MKMWYGETMEYYLFIMMEEILICRKRKEQIMKFVGKWIDKGSIILSEMTKT